MGFARDIGGDCNIVETKMDMKNIFRGFLVDVDIDQNIEIVSLSTVH